MALAHLGDAHGEHNRHDRNEALRNGRDGDRHGDHEGVKHVANVGEEAEAVLDEAREEDDHGDGDNQDGHRLRELVELDLKRCLLVFGPRDGVGDLAHLGIHAAGDHDDTSMTEDDGGAHVTHVLAVAEGNVVCPLGELDHVGTLGHRH